MNKLTQSEEYLKEQIGSFEYPYDPASWPGMEKALRKKGPGNFLKWASGFAIFTAAVITVIFIIPETNNTDKEIATNNNTIIRNITSDNNNQVKSNNNPAINNNENLNVKKDLTSKNIISQVDQSDNYSSNNQIYTNISNNLTDSVHPVTEFNDLLTRTHSKSPCPDFIMSGKEGCPPLNIQFIPSEKCDSMIYSWDFGDGKISTEKQPVHSFTKSGKYTVRLMVKYYRSDEMKTKIIENAITVYPAPKPEFDIDVQNNNVFLQTSNQDYKYTWSANDSTNQGLTAERVYMKNGKYDVSLIAQNSFGCSDTLTKSLEVNVPLIVYMPTTFAPFKEGPNQFFGPSPNPIVINYQMEIINSRGQVVYSKTGKEVSWDGYNQQNNQPCEPGIYNYKLRIWDKFGNFEQKTGSIIF